MASSREKILKKLRDAQRPFPDAPPRPQVYLPVTKLDDDSPAGLLARFTEELEKLSGEVCVVANDEAACQQVLHVLRAENTSEVLSWDFAHIPVAGLEDALREAGIEAQQPDIEVDYREDLLNELAAVPVGLTGADAAAAATATLVVSTGPGRSRIPTVLPPLHVVVIEQAQILPRLEDWVAAQRSDGFQTLQASSNLCYISGPSRTADIEKNLVLGMHGPERLQVIIKQA